MNRAGLVIALAVAVVFGVVFGIYASLDLDIAALFFDAKTRAFSFGQQTWVLRSRDAAQYLIAALVAPAFLAVIGKVMFPRWRMLIAGRAALFLILTLALAPGVVANTIFKDHWGRSRPIDVVEFGGTDRFTPWWDPRGVCPNNCSFIAGEPSGAFWTFAPSALVPAPWRALAYAGTLVFGAGIGMLRMSGGGHFFTDVVFAGVFSFLVVWMMHGMIYRWRPTRTTDEAIERPLAKTGEAIRAMFARLRQRGGKR